MFLKVVLFSSVLAAVLAKPVARRGVPSSSITPPSFGGLASLYDFDAFYGSGNFCGRSNVLVIEEQEIITCRETAVVVLQQHLAVVAEFAKQIILTQSCETETQVAVFSQWLGNLVGFGQDLRRTSGRTPVYDSAIASQLPSLFDASGGITTVPFGWSGASVGSHAVSVSGGNWNQNYSPVSVGQVWETCVAAAGPTIVLACPHESCPANNYQEYHGSETVTVYHPQATLTIVQHETHTVTYAPTHTSSYSPPQYTATTVVECAPSHTSSSVYAQHTTTYSSSSAAYTSPVVYGTGYKSVDDAAAASTSTDLPSETTDVPIADTRTDAVSESTSTLTTSTETTTSPISASSGTASTASGTSSSTGLSSASASTSSTSSASVATSVAPNAPASSAVRSGASSSPSTSSSSASTASRPASTSTLAASSTPSGAARSSVSVPEPLATILDGAFTAPAPSDTVPSAIRSSPRRVWSSRRARVA